MQTAPVPQGVRVPGFTDHHAHLLRAFAGVGFPATPQAVRDFHRKVSGQGRTPMDMPDPPAALERPGLSARIAAGLATAAAAGLVEITEMGMRSWAYLDVLTELMAAGPLPVRVRIYLASGLAEEASMAELDARRAGCGPWLRLAGVKFYADGWLVPRTCAMCQDFTDGNGRGLLFTEAAALAGRIGPLAERGWRIATHAIGDRAVQAVLDAYELAWAGDRAAIAAAAPRIEHASILSAELIARMAETGVVACIQPSFALTDAAELGPALGADRATMAYPWTELAAAGVAMLGGTDYPIEVLDPLPSLARLVSGRSRRPGFATQGAAPRQARLPVRAAFALMTDPDAGQTWLSADPRTVSADQLDGIEVLGTEPTEF
jgi:predicted amidohydrolase YtcJ